MNIKRDNLKKLKQILRSGYSIRCYDSDGASCTINELIEQAIKELDKNDILSDFEKANELQRKMISKLIKLYKINQNINNIIAEHNSKSKEKIGLNVLDLMNAIEIEDFLEKLLNKSWKEIIKEK